MITSPQLHVQLLDGISMLINNQANSNEINTPQALWDPNLAGFWRIGAVETEALVKAFAVSAKCHRSALVVSAKWFHHANSLLG